MAETNYAPDPRVSPLRFYENRGFGPGKRSVFKDRSPNPPIDRTQAALSYTAAGVLVAWNPVTQAWVSIASGSSGSSAGASLPANFTDSMAFDDFEAYTVGSISALNQGSGWGADGVVTGGTIVTRTNSNSRSDKRLSLAGPGELFRKMPWGSSWKCIRIGLCMRINAGATFNGEFDVGVNSGSSVGFQSSSCLNWIGTTTRNGNTNAFTFGSGSDVGVFQATFRGHGTKRGSTFTDSAGISSANHFPATEAFRCINIIDIRRNRYAASNTYTLKTFGPGAINTPNLASAEQDSDVSAMLFAMLNGDIANNMAWFWDGQSNSTNITFDESTGALDTINLYWSHASNPLELSAFGVSKLA